MATPPRLPLNIQIGTVTPIELVSDGTLVHERIYRVVHQCCGRIEEMSQHAIRKRWRECRRWCDTCARTRVKKPDAKPRPPKHPLAFRIVAEIPESERPVVPDAQTLLALWIRANARVRAKNALPDHAH